MNPKVQTIIEHAFARPLLKNWEGGDPKPAFDNGSFSAENWNDGRCNVLRSLLDCVAVHGSCEFDWDGDNACIFHNWLEDQHYVFIVVQNGPLYHIEWHKSRGRTEVINKDGKPVTEAELHDLVQHLGEDFGGTLAARMGED